MWDKADAYKKSIVIRKLAGSTKLSDLHDSFHMWCAGLTMSGASTIASLPYPVWQARIGRDRYMYATSFDRILKALHEAIRDERPE